MRLKLLLIASILAAVIGTGSSVAIVVWSLGSLPRSFAPALSAHRWLAVVTFVPPLALACVACFFVYRHTARRRKLQAAITAILVVLLSIAGHIAAWFVF